MTKVNLLNGDILILDNVENVDEIVQIIASHLSVPTRRVVLSKMDNDVDTYFAVAQPRPRVRIPYRLSQLPKSISHHNWNWMDRIQNVNVIEWFLHHIDNGDIPDQNGRFARNPHPRCVEWALKRADQPYLLLNLNKNESDEVMDYLFSHPEKVCPLSVVSNRHPRVCELLDFREKVTEKSEMHELEWSISNLSRLLVFPTDDRVKWFLQATSSSSDDTLCQSRDMIRNICTGMRRMLKEKGKEKDRERRVNGEENTLGRELIKWLKLNEERLEKYQPKMLRTIWALSDDEEWLQKYLKHIDIDEVDICFFQNPHHLVVNWILPNIDNLVLHNLVQLDSDIAECVSKNPADGIVDWLIQHPDCILPEFYTNRNPRAIQECVSQIKSGQASGQAGMHATACKLYAAQTSIEAAEMILEDPNEVERICQTYYFIQVIEVVSIWPDFEIDFVLISETGDE